MRASSSTLEEGADMDASTPGRVTVTITWSGTYDGDTTRSGASDPRKDVFTSGDSGNHVRLTATVATAKTSPPHRPIHRPIRAPSALPLRRVRTDDASFGNLGDSTMGAELKFAPTSGPDDGTVEKTIELYISDDEDDGDWDEEKLVLTLELVDRSVTVVTKRPIPTTTA